MKGRVGAGSVANAGTMNVFQYAALKGIDSERPEENSFCTYSVTEDKASEIEYFIKGYYSVFHPYQVSSGVPANSVSFLFIIFFFIFFFILSGPVKLYPFLWQKFFFYLVAIKTAKSKFNRKLNFSCLVSTLGVDIFFRTFYH